jgi:hypothetical protein
LAGKSGKPAQPIRFTSPEEERAFLTYSGAVRPATAMQAFTTARRLRCLVCIVLNAVLIGCFFI